MPRGPCDAAAIRRAALCVDPLVAAGAAGNHDEVRRLVEVIRSEVGIEVGPSDFSEYWSSESAEQALRRAVLEQRGAECSPAAARARRFLDALIASGIVKMAWRGAVHRVVSALVGVLPSTGSPVDVGAVVGALTDCADVGDVMGDDEELLNTVPPLWEKCLD